MRPLLLFDGVCAVCNGAVTWILARDRARVFRFAPLQGEVAAAVRGRHPEWPDRLDSLVLVLGEGPAERLLWHSDAVIGMLEQLPAPWSFARMLRVVPRFLRDPAYRLFAAIRYRVFGAVDSCRVVDPEDQERFLS